MTGFEHMPEPPPGATVRDDRGHEWRRDGSTAPDDWPFSDYLWWGCVTCDDRQVIGWSWRMILQDTYDSVLTVEMP